MSNECLFVIHIPKTAGTTLVRIIAHQYESENVYRIGSDIQGDRTRFRELSEEEMGNCQLVIGHFCYGLHSTLSNGRDYDYITLLRDPVQRAISEWAYVRRAKSHYLREAAEQMTLEQFVTSGITCTLDDGMVRQLCGEDMFKTVDGQLIAGDDMMIPFGCVSADHLEAAKANIKRDFVLVGTMESFDESLALLCLLFGWSVEPYPNLNVSPGKPLDPTAETREAIVERSKLDYELYSWAEARLEQIIKAQGI